MEIRVTDWVYRNLRLGPGEQLIDLGIPPKRWSLVQMPNGTGKTTTMELMRAVLTAQQLTPEEVRGFRSDDVVEDGSFELGLLIDDARYRLKLDLDFKESSYAYSTIRAKERGGGRESGRVLPPGLHHLLKPNFTRLFVFDGELAKQIREVDRSEADRAIRTLYQLDELTTLRRHVEQVVEKRQAAAASMSEAKTSKGLSRWRKALKSAKGVLRDLKADLDQKKAEEVSLQKQEHSIRVQIDEYIDEHGNLHNEKAEIEDEARSIQGKLKSAVQTARDAFRSPVALSPLIEARLNDLGQTLTNARLPKSVSSDFFIELAEEDTCVCGRPIGDTERAEIKLRKDIYLGQDQISAISTMKDMLRKSGKPEISFQSACKEIHDQMQAEKANKTREDKLVLSLSNHDKEEIESLQALQRQVANDLEVLRREIDKLEATEPTRQKLFGCTEKNNIALADKHMKDCSDRLDVASNSYKLARQRDKLLDQLSRIEERALETLRQLIREETNKRLATLVQMEHLQIDKIDGALALTSDRVAERKNVSEGQSLSVAYAFLTSLLSEAPFDLPFIVDSPAVSLDLNVRREVGRIIPGLFKQMIMFVISSEQAGFAEAFYDQEDALFVSLIKGSDEEIVCEYGLETFKQHAEEGHEA